MTEIVYKPTSEYKETLNTAATKQDLINYLILNGIRIVKYGNSVVATEIYKVPDGKTFFLTSYSANISGGTVVREYVAKLSIYNINEWFIRLSTQCNTLNASTSESISVTPILPIKFSNGEAFIAELIGGGAIGLVTITGIEISTAVIPGF